MKVSGYAVSDTKISKLTLFFSILLFRLVTEVKKNLSRLKKGGILISCITAQAANNDQFTRQMN